MEKRATKQYVLFITLGERQPEHSQLPNALRAASNDRFKAIPTPAGLLVFMDSELWPIEIAGHFGKILLNQDSYVILELGKDWWVSKNQSAAQGWLNTHRPKPR